MAAAILGGIDRPTRGKVLIDGKDVTGVSVRKRSIAMVCQQFIIYPSLTVYNNGNFALNALYI
jgi:glycerol transport system ATP-binding protein